MDLANERQKIEQLFSELERQANALLFRLEVYNEETLQTPMEPGVWSVMQVLSHILASERLSLKYIKKKLSFQPQLKNAGIAASLRLLLLRIYLMSPLKFKAPKGVRSEDLPPQGSLEEFRDTWFKERQELKEYIQGLNEDMLRKEIYKHPFVGRLSLTQMLIFFQFHFRRHEKQILSRLP